jgi:hypothetical protein
MKCGDRSFMASYGRRSKRLAIVCAAEDELGAVEVFGVVEAK